ncbi:MAG TPA: hypothetical protein VEX68_13170 [Bryobacteraceae bacterium]|nr:hypothetical protein [Bryobacteraceae bacterium]
MLVSTHRRENAQRRTKGVKWVAVPNRSTRSLECVDGMKRWVGFAVMPTT